MKKNLAVLFIFLTSFTCLAQETKDNATTNAKPVEWVRVQNATGEFSIEIPSNFVYFFDQDGFNMFSGSKRYYYAKMEMLNAAFEKTVMRVEIFKVPNPKDHLEQLIDRERIRGSKSENSQEGFTIKQFSGDKFESYITKKVAEISFVTRLIASKSFLYVVTVANRGAASAASKRFLSSIRLNQRNLAGSEKIVDLASIKPITIDDIAGKAKKEDDPKEQAKTDKPLEEPENPVFILARPFAAYTDAARETQTSGTVRLRVTFEKDGRISKILVIKGLENGLTRQAVMAALRIRFLPLEKENKLETATKTVEYSFSVG